MRKVLILVVILAALGTAGKDQITAATDVVHTWVIAQFGTTASTSTVDSDMAATPEPVAEVRVAPLAAPSPAIRSSAPPATPSTVAPLVIGTPPKSGDAKAPAMESFEDWYRIPEECKKPSDKVFVKCVEHRRQAKLRYQDEMRQATVAGATTGISAG